MVGRSDASDMAMIMAAGRCGRKTGPLLSRVVGRKLRTTYLVEPPPMSVTDTIGVGFIGAGDVAILHDRAVKRCPGARLVGLWNRSQDRARLRASEFGCRNFETPEALVNDPSIDAVFVLTNLETHLEYTRLALAAGKHVLVEKPIGVTVAEIAEMKRLADSNKLVCMPGHNYVYEASMMRTRELVEDGDL